MLKLYSAPILCLCVYVWLTCLECSEWLNVALVGSLLVKLATTRVVQPQLHVLETAGATIQAVFSCQRLP